ncbi:hypothetical protein PTSG_08534 [Salpingoeca rosetta]|uniref:Uncharacterized protein n=1 Tax=Salpingoeca rosetta (strain ATCC 50818 / BSB-021) TaxID=946362 RepID=F2UJY8_SALR5|nr:uncharacterized protein PTSG_08534 [Salpingoeca rosetta]EGD77437.1 hypothetical protein PTSG_08534 [Salpingoeca rosetta]|eukprot:XP_004990325.1 hypothetical protein PTSG_08534 [Salpingoeca rosetta]
MKLTAANRKKLFHSIERGDFITTYELLKGGFKPETQDPSGYTAAGWAVFNSKSGVLKIMLERGLNPNLSASGISLLHVAAMNGKHLMAKMLLRAGADATAKDLRGMTPADSAKDDVTRTVLNTPLASLSPETEFDVGEQVFCSEDNGTRRPAEIVSALPNKRFSVQLLGFNTKLEVDASALTKVNVEEVERQLKFMQQAKDARKQQQQQQRARARARSSIAPIPSEPTTPLTTATSSAFALPTVDSSSLRGSRRGSVAARDTTSSKRRAGSQMATPPSSARAPKTPKMAATTDATQAAMMQQLNQALNALESLKDTVASLTTTATAAATPVAVPTFTGGAAVGAGVDATTAQLLEENRTLQEMVDMLRAQQQESKAAFATSPAMTQSMANKEDADRIKVIAELRTKCIQLEAERDRYKRLMEISAAKYARLSAAHEAAKAEAEAEARQQEEALRKEEEEKKGKAAGGDDDAQDMQTGEDGDDEDKKEEDKEEDKGHEEEESKDTDTAAATTPPAEGESTTTTTTTAAAGDDDAEKETEAEEAKEEEEDEASKQHDESTEDEKQHQDGDSKEEDQQKEEGDSKEEPSATATTAMDTGDDEQDAAATTAPSATTPATSEAAVEEAATATPAVSETTPTAAPTAPAEAGTEEKTEGQAEKTQATAPTVDGDCSNQPATTTTTTAGEVA